jgi:3-hydroxyacyl-[acyl-carrier-protein] dehydratase
MGTEGRDVRFVIGHDHPALPGHFPGQPVVPGVVLLDRVLEAVEREAGPLGALSLPQVKFLQPLLPGEEARVELEPLAASPGARWRFRVLRGEALLASGDVAEAS